MNMSAAVSALEMGGIELTQAALVDFDASFLYHLALFIITAIALNVVVFKPMLQVESLRHSKTQGAVESTGRLQKLARERVAEYERAVDLARKSGNEAFNKSRDSSQAAATHRIDRAREQADQRINEATTALRGKFDMARKEVGLKSKELADKIADQVVGR